MVQDFPPLESKYSLAVLFVYKCIYMSGGSKGWKGSAMRRTSILLQGTSLRYSHYTVFFVFLMLFLREREREHEQGKGRERERETKNLKQAPSCQHRARFGARTHEL